MEFAKEGRLSHTLRSERGWLKASYYLLATKRPRNDIRGEEAVADGGPGRGARNLHFVVDHGQGVRLAGFANREREGLSVGRNLVRCAIHDLVFHFVGDFQSAGV